MSERRFVLADFTYMTTECLNVYEAGNMYTMPLAVAHAAAKHGLVARERPADWSQPSILKSPEILTPAMYSRRKQNCARCNVMPSR
jgi:hypothetical protein